MTRYVHRWVVLGALVPVVALADGEMAAYEAAVAELQKGTPAAVDSAAVALFELSEHSALPDVRRQAEYQLGRALELKGYSVAASIYYSGVIKEGPSHPYQLQAVEGLVRVQDKLRDPFLIPSALDHSFDTSWSKLAREPRARVNYLVALTSQRANKLEEARQFAEEVPEDSPVFAKSQYLLGVLLADPRYPGGPQDDPALASFQRVIDLKDKKQQDLAQVRELALLGKGRLLYAQKKYEEAVKTYEAVPRFSRYWDQALFELGFARFRAEDYGGALGALQALHAPQFEAAFQPESWLLKATIYYFSCLYDEAAASMKAFHTLYQPMRAQMEPLLTQEHELQDYFTLINDPKDQRLPRPVKLWVRNNERIIGLFKLLEEIDREKAAARSEKGWAQSRIADALDAYLDQNREVVVQTAGQLVKNRLTEATENIKKYTNDGSLIRFETTLRQKDLYEQGVDQGKVLNAQQIHRPGMPGEDWNYWAFQGEFWIDEIGYYQYTLKQGCPAPKAEAEAPEPPRPPEAPAQSSKGAP
ncbi:MAG TPA: tetratricopeptide repeat protein [Myxococcaceae bacterium]|nr:tetratricopeptide repeat protein [Myxococcaceae bacterium]